MSFLPFRTLNSELQWIARHSLSDIAFEHNRCATSPHLNFTDPAAASALAKPIKTTAGFRNGIRCCVFDVWKAAVLMCGDCSFASVDGETELAGSTCCLTKRQCEVVLSAAGYALPR